MGDVREWIIVQTQDGIELALAAIMTQDDLRMLVHSSIYEAMHESPDNVGLHPPGNQLGDRLELGFWPAVPPMCPFWETEASCRLDDSSRNPPSASGVQV